MTADVASPAIETITTPSNIARQQPTQPPLSQLFSHTQITEDFDQLIFRAAASLQIQWPPAPAQTSTTKADTRLIASPYNAEPHLLDLTTLDTQSRLLALALASFRPVRDDYATAEYLDSFNWQEVFDLVKAFAAAEGHAWTKQSFYVVSFRSQLQDGVDQELLHALDAYSHQEAVASGGLLKYWFGTKDGERRNLATCIWRSREDARLGGRGPWHAKARLAARELYERIVFSTMRLVIDDGVASWEMGEWNDEGHH